MTLRRISDHVAALGRTLWRMDDPLPADPISLFNKLLEKARARKGETSLVHEIPFLGPDVTRDELMLWLDQLYASLDTFSE
jgi:hypothetical protein